MSPDSYTDAGRIEAVERFENDLGHELRIIHSYHPWEHQFPSDFDRYVASRQGSTLLLSWAGTDTDAIVAGEYDDMIRTRARAVKELDVPILLRWRWEMNRPNLQQEIGSPEAYIAAWRHIRRLFDEEGTDQVSWVWCPLAHDFTSTQGAAYYPGDDDVDWLCADAYSHGVHESLGDRLAQFMTWAESRPRPVMIGEFSMLRTPGSDMTGWLDEAREFVRDHPQIAAAVFYESDNAEAGPYAVSPDPAALEALRRWVNDRRFSPDW